MKEENFAFLAKPAKCKTGVTMKGIRTQIMKQESKEL
jgi:hypothetical protein